MSPRAGDTCPECGRPYAIQVGDFDHLRSCSRSVASRRARLREQSWPDAEQDRVDRELRGGMPVSREPGDACPCPACTTERIDSPMYRGRAVSELEERVEADRDRVNRRFAG